MRARTTLAVALLTASAAFFVIRHAPGVFTSTPRGFELDPDQKRLLKEARAAYAVYPTLTLTEERAIEDIRRVLDAAPEQPVPPATAQVSASLTPEQARRYRAEINRLMAEFLLYAVFKQDPHAYVGWRHGRRDRLMSREEMERKIMLTDSWTYLTGSPPPDNLTSLDVFIFYHELGMSRTPPDRRVVGIANHPDATFTQVWFSNPHIPFAPPLPEPLGEHGWNGSQVSGGSGYFIGSIPREDLYMETVPILQARCGVILVTSSGLRQPLILYAFRTPTDGKWNIDYVHFGNMDPENPIEMTW